MPSAREQYLQALASLSDLTRTQAERVASLLAKQGEVQSAQVNRVAEARGVTPDQVRELVLENQDGRVFGFFGEARVNVLQLNLDLDEKYPVKS